MIRNILFSGTVIIVSIFSMDAICVMHFRNVNKNIHNSRWVDTTDKWEDSTDLFEKKQEEDLQHFLNK